jgi:hypothetical protein
VAVVVARNRRDVPTRPQLGLDLAHAVLGRCAVDAASLDECDDAGVDLASGRRLVPIHRLDRLSRRIRVAKRAQPLRDAQSEDTGDGDADKG